MNEAIAMSNLCAAGKDAVASHCAHQLPLSFLKTGDEASILKVRGDKDMQRHLGTLGFVPGAHLRVVSGVSGDIIVEIKATQVALSRQVALNIVVARS